MCLVPQNIHNVMLKNVLKWLIRRRITLNVSSNRKNEILLHVIDQDTLHLDPEKNHAITEMSTLRNQVDLERFVHD